MKTKKIVINHGIFLKVKILTLICLMGLSSWMFILTSCSQTKNEESLTFGNAPEPVSESTGIAEKEPLSMADQIPVFPGGEDQLMKFLAEKTSYPEDAKKNNIQGKVIVRFCVTEKGDVNQVSVVTSVDPLLDKEAIRVVQLLPAFEPGMKGGKAVPVWMMVPINFALK